jgi:D-alanine-D-alanine ligase
VYLNICEGYELDGDADENDWDYQGIDVVNALEELNLPYTGATPRFFDPTREEMQAAADAHGVGFAKGYRVTRLEEAQRLVENLRYPIMVKHPKSYGSTGMFRESRVDTPEQLARQVERICSEFGAARMEEFIVGKEYNVLVVDNPDEPENPIAYPPAELVFPPGEEFWHTDVKWDYNVPFDFKQVTDPELVARLQDTAIRMYKAIGGESYGRCDVRMNEQGELFILEINPNPAIMLRPEDGHAGALLRARQGARQARRHAAHPPLLHGRRRRGHRAVPAHRADQRGGAPRRRQDDRGLPEDPRARALEP